MGNCGLKLKKSKKEEPEDEVYMSFREVINSPKRNEVIDLTIKKRPNSTSTCSIRPVLTTISLNFRLSFLEVLELERSRVFYVSRSQPLKDSQAHLAFPLIMKSTMNFRPKTNMISPFRVKND